ncbi:MAG: hypothetical protein RMY28_034190 [Nostoc sp. ChiSLP01]|nr:hypothetical protein [Nostoc sp. CmiSLP01]MDZ8283481.1 hypothetical protein [Nostoc sp. ChiSLP01]
MSFAFFEQRLKDLEDNIAKAQKLRSEYEEQFDLSEDPRTRGRAERNIEQLKESGNRYYKEFEELQQQLKNQEQQVVQSESGRLAKIEGGLRVLMSGQIAILGRLNQTQQVLLCHYNSTQRKIVAEITKQLNQNQLELIQILLDAIETNEVSKVEIEEMWALLEERLSALPPAQTEIAEIIQDPNLDARHKLKLCIPIIPLILEYESELELGSGLNIKTLWEQVKIRLRRK